MAKSVFSASWYRVSSLKPRLRSHAQIHRHQYRGETWYVLQELAKERFFRFTPSAYFVVGLMDGKLTVGEIWTHACERLADDAPTQDEMIELLSQLYQADVLQSDVSPDAGEILQRRKDQTKREWQSKLLSIFSWRFPLIDPDRFIRFMLPIVRPFFSWAGALIWLAIIIPAAGLFWFHFKDLTQGVLDRVFIPQNLIILWVLFPIIKTFHEFGHAFATRAFGGEVHDMGIMILVLTPVPYVDASSASAFREKWRRVVVGAAGMLVELLIAAFALFVWANAQPGFVRSLAYNTVFIAGATTILFNANPLLRYDGYYILGDLLEIPNLRTRSTNYLVYLCERYLFGNDHLDPPSATKSERAWFVTFATLSSIYRVFVVTAILLYVGTKLFNLGALLAIAGAVVWMVFPVAKGGYYLATSPRLRPVRPRAITVSVVLAALIVGFIALVPMPYRSGAEGVVWVPEEALVRAGAEGFITSVTAASGSSVRGQQELMTLDNPLLASQEKVVLARIQELQAKRIQLIQKPVEAEINHQDLKEAEGRLKRIREEIADLSVRSRAQGTFIVRNPEDLQGRFVRKGDLLGYVLQMDHITVRAVVSQDRIDMVRNSTYAAQVRLSEHITEPVPAVIKRIVPGATEELPSSALGTGGGGKIATDPTDRRGLTAVQKGFQVDLEFPSSSHLVNVGGRGYVRFDHGYTPLAVQWYFKIRQLFLSRFNV